MSVHFIPMFPLFFVFFYILCAFMCYFCLYLAAGFKTDDDSHMFDDDDINCEIRNTFVPTNMLLHRFDNNCSVAVKRMLFKS